MRLHSLAGFFLVAALGSAAAAVSSQPLADGWYLLNKELLRPEIPAAQRHPAVFTAGVGVGQGLETPTALLLSGDARGTAAMPKIQRIILAQPQVSFETFGGLERRIPLAAWRGKRLRLSLASRNGGGAFAYVSAQINRSNFTAIRTASAMNTNRNGTWKAHNFVLDVPDDATDLILIAGLTGSGRIWLDGFSMQAADRDAPLSWSERLAPQTHTSWDNPIGYLPPVGDPQAEPGPVRADER